MFHGSLSDQHPLLSVCFPVKFLLHNSLVLINYHSSPFSLLVLSFLFLILSLWVKSGLMYNFQYYSLRHLLSFLLFLIVFHFTATSPTVPSASLGFPSATLPSILTTLSILTSLSPTTCENSSLHSLISSLSSSPSFKFDMITFFFLFSSWSLKSSWNSFHISP